MNLKKIDSSLFGVQVLKSERTNCVVFVSDFFRAEKFLVDFHISIIARFRSLNAFGIECDFFLLDKLSDFVCVTYITTVSKASCFMHSSRAIVGVDKLHRKNILGNGVGVAVIDTGCYPHLDFMIGKKKKFTFVDFVNEKLFPYDDNGHGTFVCGVLCGSGASSAGVYCGVAPESELIVLKALDESGKAQGYKVLEAMDWILSNFTKFNIRVVCMSFGCSPLSKFDALRIGADTLWDAGIVVVSAVGNDGPAHSSIKSPAISSKIISVGSVDIRDGIKVADFSSRGPSFDCIKPDLVAPGVEVTSLSNLPKLFTSMSGTSVSAPFVAGTAALILEKYPHLSPNEIKARIMYSAVNFDADINEGGMGLLNSYVALNFDKYR